MNEIALFENMFQETPIYPLNMAGNEYYIKRDDNIPFSFGGNKARKARYFYQDIKAKKSDCVVTYGSSSSNHVRIIANMACAMGLDCFVISPEENYEVTANTRIIQELGITVWKCPITRVKDTIDEKISELTIAGKNPYFIMGGGHGILGTKAYVECFEEILSYEERSKVSFDYIFHASGTGGTQAGLLCGQIINQREDLKIIGISIARKEEQGSKVVLESVKEYIPTALEEDIQRKLYFTDKYICGGYGQFENGVVDTVKEVFAKEGIPMDTTYVGKAFYGMKEYCQKHKIEDKKILFIHTGGTPLYFDCE